MLNIKNVRNYQAAGEKKTLVHNDLQIAAVPSLKTEARCRMSCQR